LEDEGGAEKRLRERERRFDEERRMRIKRSEEYEALEEVFDKRTLLLIYGMLNKGALSELGGVVSAGKESRVYFGRAHGRDLAVKIYLTGSAEFRRGMMQYIEGDHRFAHIRRGDVRSIIGLWARKEFVNLKEFRRVGVSVPEPLHVEGNVLIMEFIGEDGLRAPLLNEVTLPEPASTYERLIQAIRLMVREAGLVHGDLSEFNVMMWNGLPVVIDVSQSLPLSHPLANDLLARDIDNINKFFKGQGVDVVDAQGLLQELTRSDSS
jgi:RIO kinase 1